MLGALGAMAPSRKRDITKIVIRAMIAGNVACFMTACIAGKFKQYDNVDEFIFSFAVTKVLICCCIYDYFR